MVFRCRAVQVGDHNRQFRHHRCELMARVDFGRLLRRPAVAQPLTELALDPDNNELRARVMEQLCFRRWEFVGSDTLALGRVERPDRAESARVTPGDTVLTEQRVPGTEGSVIIRDCDGVQIGDHGRQEAEFDYLSKRPQLNEARLLREYPAVAAALVDTVIGRAEPGPAGPLHEELVRALRSCQVDLPEFGTVNRSRDTLSVHDADGVSYGRDNQVSSSQELRPRIKMVSDPGREQSRFAGRARALGKKRQRIEEHAGRRADRTAADPAQADGTSTPGWGIPHPDGTTAPGVRPSGTRDLRDRSSDRGIGRMGF